MIDRLTVATALLAAAIAGCQTGSPNATDGVGPGSSATAEASDDAPPSLGPPPSPSPPDAATPVTLDPTVLAFLPGSVNGIPVTESIDEATQALDDVSLPRIATSVDAGVAVDAGSGNLVYAWVLRLRPDKFTDDIYRQWRDTYDEGACSGAGGVTGHAEATIDDRTIYVGSCVQSLRTYHVWLKDQAILISASAIGDGKFGELLMDNLRVPA